jgi:hypothetical protein
MLHEIQHDESGTDDDDFHGNDALLDIDCPISSIQAYATNFCPSSGSLSPSNKFLMPSNKWFSLSNSNKSIWDRLDDQANSIILGYVTPTYPNSSLLPSFSMPPFSLPFTGKRGYAKSSPGNRRTYMRSLLMIFSLQICMS